MYEMKCKKCNHTWQAEEKKLECPNCKASGPGIIGFKFNELQRLEDGTKKELEANVKAVADNELKPKSNVELAIEKAKAEKK